MRHVLALLTVIVAGCGSCSCGGSSGGDDDAPIPCGDTPEEHTGEGTYYAADGSGNCGFEATPGDLMVAAMNNTDYDGAAACGACISVDGPDGSVTVRIVDRCPGCPDGDVDLSEQAFAAIAPLKRGRIPITWRYVPCAVDGPIRYRFKDGSNAFWVAIQIRNHRHGIAKLEARRADGTYAALSRASYNYFLETSGLGEGPYALRVTDVHGLVVEDGAVPLGDNTEAAGAQQLPVCQ